MLENEIAPTDAAPEEGSGDQAPTQPAEDISYHAVEKDGQVTAIWEMQGRKHVRTIDPRSRQGQDILRLYTTEHHDETTGFRSQRSSFVVGSRFNAAVRVLARHESHWRLFVFGPVRLRRQDSWARLG